MTNQTNAPRRPVLPRKVAEALDYARRHLGWDAETTLRRVLDRQSYRSFSFMKTLKSVDPFDLADALRYGYEIEKAPEEQAVDYYRGLLRIKSDPNEFPEDRYVAHVQATAVRRVLEILGVDVPDTSSTAADSPSEPRWASTQGFGKARN